MGGFAKLGIMPRETKGGGGDKIDTKRIFGRRITITDYVIEPSEFKGQRLRIYFTMNDIEYMTINGSVSLMDMIAKVPKERFPITTSIVVKEMKYVFT